jgi:hypothetical protein
MTGLQGVRAQRMFEKSDPMAESLIISLRVQYLKPLFSRSD